MFRTNKMLLETYKSQTCAKVTEDPEERDLAPLLRGFSNLFCV